MTNQGRKWLSVRGHQGPTIKPNLLIDGESHTPIVRGEHLVIAQLLAEKIRHPLAISCK
jgi:hypothetical protein